MLILGSAFGSVLTQLYNLNSVKTTPKKFTIDKFHSKTYPSPTLTQTPKQLSNEINSMFFEYRKSIGLKVTTESVPTCAVAAARLIEVQGDWSHDGYYKYRYIINAPHTGENLARDYIDPKSVFDGWIKSPTHKENLDRPEWKHMCIATDGKYVVQIFSD